jgi:polysaccharide biosynthesis protein PslE
MNRTTETTPIFVFLKNAATRHWGKSLLFFLCSTSLVLAATVYWGNSYRSDARLFVRLGKESVSIDPTVPTNGAITLNEGREIEINSVLQILQSRELAKRVVETIGIETILSGQLSENHGEASKPSRWSELVKQIRILKDGREVSRYERAVTGLLRSLKVSSPRRTSVVHVQFDSDSPEVAQKVVDEVIETFKMEHARINRTAGSYEFLINQTQLLEKKLLEAQNEMRDLKNDTGLVSIEGHQRILQDELALLENQLVHAKSDLSGSKARVASLKESAAQLPERQEIEGVQVANDATSQMRDTLYQLQLRERELGAKYREDHPEYRVIAEQARNALAIYEMQATERDQKTVGLNSAKQQLEVALLVEKANHDSLQARCSTLQEQHATATRRMKSLNADEVRLTELQRNVEQAEVAFKTYASKTEQARLEQQLENQRISNINIIQPASFVEKPASPNRLLLLFLGLMFASCGCVGVAILCELVVPAKKRTIDRIEVRDIATSISASSSWHHDSALSETHAGTMN